MEHGPDGRDGTMKGVVVDGEGGETGRPGRGRSIASAVLLAVAIVTAPLLIVAVWADQQITNTDRYVDAVSGLSDDPRVQQYVASELANAFSEHVNVDAELKKVLPQELQSLSPTLAPVWTASSRRLPADSWRARRSTRFGSTPTELLIVPSSPC